MGLMTTLTIAAAFLGYRVGSFSHRDYGSLTGLHHRPYHVDISREDYEDYAATSYHGSA
jgi:hypothetical protein